ncbi:hypothetical protein B0E53_05616 [Micromonospora sp. MH33]|nr:hypothetical protein B0E53_05616 [Micromonospora sp. MH33]
MIIGWAPTLLAAAMKVSKSVFGATYPPGAVWVRQW